MNVTVPKDWIVDYCRTLYLILNKARAEHLTGADIDYLKARFDEVSNYLAKGVVEDKL